MIDRILATFFFVAGVALLVSQGEASDSFDTRKEVKTEKAHHIVVKIEK